MKKGIVLLLTVVLALTCFFGCSEQQEQVVEVSDPAYYEKYKDAGITINVYNWGEYISDGSDDSLDVNKAFEQLTGIKVNYTNFATNEELYAKLKGGATNYDIIIPSDYMIGKMISEDMLEELNFDNIPNYELIDDKYKNLDFDPDNKYSVPYTWGTVGIIYDKTVVSEEEASSWDVLWNEKYADNILMFANSRDAFGISLLRLGYSLNTEDELEITAAAEELKKQKPLVQAYVMDEIFDKMISGEAVVAPYYAGDAITMMADNENLAFSIPDEGTNFFVDSMCIPKGAKQKDAAEMYINFLCETQVAAQNCEYIGYSTPHTLAIDELSDEMKNSPIAYPSQEVLDNTEVFLSMPENINKLYDELWTEILTERP